MHASHIIDNKSVVVVVANGMEEYTPYPFSREALRIQRKFELEKAFKILGVRQMYTLNQDLNNIDYELIAIKLQLLTATQPFTHLFYMINGDQRLVNISNAIIGNVEKRIYKPKGKEKWAHRLDENEIERKLDAIEKMVTVRRELLAHDLTKEYVQR
jgi:LmbE family N-acetylglucosaminyl deacetylase